MLEVVGGNPIRVGYGGDFCVSDCRRHLCRGEMRGNGRGQWQSMEASAGTLVLSPLLESSLESADGRVTTHQDI